MKVGDKFPVTLAGHAVVEATVTLMEDGIATLEFPGQRVKMSYVTQLAPDAPAQDAPVEPSKQTIVTGVDRRDTDGNVILSTGEPNRESAPVGDEPVETQVESASVAPVAVEGAQEAPVAPLEPAESAGVPAEG